MSDADSFIQEVSEEVRRDRMFRLWRRWAPLIIGLIVLAVAATAFDAWRKGQREQAARDAGAALIEAAESGDPARRAEDLLAAADALDGGPATLARLRAAADLAAAGNAEDAARAYRAVAEDAAVDPVFAAFAAYRAAVVGAAVTGPADAIAALNPLAAEGQPFRILALEARGALKLQSGDAAGARADLEAVLADPTATEGVRSRVNALLGTFTRRDAA